MAQPTQGVDLQALARDWITIVQSEMAGLAEDREARESFALLLSVWAAAATAMVGVARPPPAPPTPPATGHDGAAAAPGATAPAPSPDPRDAQIDELGRRVAELERRLAAAGAGPGRARPARKPRRPKG